MRLTYPTNVKIIRVPCTGKVDLLHILKAFEKGADFICVGMFDFQVVEDVNTTIDVLDNLKGRTRQWYG